MSVVQALLNNDLYKRRGYLPETMVQIYLIGSVRSYLVGQIEYEDVALFGDEMDKTLAAKRPSYQRIFADYATHMVTLMRSINKTTFSGFRGSGSVGRQLTALPLVPGLFVDPDLPYTGVPKGRTSWERKIQSAGESVFICGDTRGPLNLTEHEGLAILGFDNLAKEPCASSFQIQHIGYNYQAEPLDFDNLEPAEVTVEKLKSAAADTSDGGSLEDIFTELRTGLRKTAPAEAEQPVEETIKSIVAQLTEAVMLRARDTVIELKQPLLVFPNENCQITVRYSKPGVDKLRPIGVWFKMAQEVSLI